MGKYNLGVGVIHRGPTNDKPGDPIPMIYHDYTAETYIITSGSGILTTGGTILNKQASAGVNVMNGAETARPAIAPTAESADRRHHLIRRCGCGWNRHRSRRISASG